MIPSKAAIEFARKKFGVSEDQKVNWTMICAIFSLASEIDEFIKPLVQDLAITKRITIDALSEAMSLRKITDPNTMIKNCKHWLDYWVPKSDESDNQSDVK